jgi:hypothetical protein
VELGVQGYWNPGLHVFALRFGSTLRPIWCVRSRNAQRKWGELEEAGFCMGPQRETFVFRRR